MISARASLGLILAWLASTASLAAVCSFPGEPNGPSALRLVKVVDGFERPVVMAYSPDRADTFYIVEQYGLLKAVVAGVVQTQAVLDLTNVIDDNGNETGFLGLAFHPHFTQNRKLYIYYTGKNPLHTVVSEFRMETDGRINPSTERILFTVPQPFSNHNGGNLAFGPDGYLYIGLGDGGSANDPNRNGQNLHVLLAKMLRIDVDHGNPYAIPADNPTFGDAQAKREIFAYGLRNPWRFSFDKVTGDLWVGDVGQDSFEEIDIVQKGGNYGWNTMEGNSCFRTATCNRTGMSMPVRDYPRSEGASVTGGFVYRGQVMPDLIGTYIYADYVGGKISGLRYDGTRMTENKVLADAGLNISSFGQDPQGELYVLDHTGGVVYKLAPASATQAAADFPRTVTATGCFSSLNPLTPAAGVTTYDVSSPLWSDGAAKDRFVYVPSGQKVRLAADGTFQFPDDTVFVKNFAMPIRAGGQSINRIVETRFLVKRSSGFKGYSYRWNDAGTEAQLLGGAATRDMVLGSSTGDEAYSYYFPGSGDCIRCHAPGTGGSLGFDAGHLNFGNPNQLTRLAQLGILDTSTLPGDLHTLPSYPNPTTDSAASLDARARSYLHTQCAECHNRAFGTAQGNFDLRYALSLADSRVCNTAPVTGDLGVPGAKILVPGDPDHSLLWLRVHSLAKGQRMPPLATSRLDTAGAALIRQWISSLTACP